MAAATRTNASTKEGIAEQENRRKEEQIKLRLGAAEMLNTPYARKVMFSMLLDLGVFDIETSIYSPDPVTLAHRVGTQEAGKRIARALRDAAKNEYRRMVIENMEGVRNG